MLARTLVATALILTLAAPAWAGSKSIVTPPLIPASDGRPECVVVNASSNRALTVQIAIVTYWGAFPVLINEQTVNPGSAASAMNTDNDARYCYVAVISGSTKDALVSLIAMDASGRPVAAVYSPTK